MSTYEFGDIIDCRQSPHQHFLLILGVNQKDEIMFYMITSRTYKVFRDILAFFNDCIADNHTRFFNHFGKEKGVSKIYPTGNLSDAFFLDCHANYNGCLDKDSMVLINSQPQLEDKAVMNKLHTEGKAIHRSRLTKEDTQKLIGSIKLSGNVSEPVVREISRNYNLWKKS